MFRTEKEQFWGVDLLYHGPIQKVVTRGLPNLAECAIPSRFKPTQVDFLLSPISEGGLNTE
jgi:hypothetical protein